MKIVVLGYTESGKTTVADMIAETRGVSYINTSDVLIDDFAAHKGIDGDEIRRDKDRWREDLFNFGRSRQASDPLYLIREPLKDADIITGLRNPNELDAAKKAKLVDLIIWVDRPGCNAGTTDKLNRDDADIVINNNAGLEELHNIISILFGNNWVDSTF